MVDEKELDLIDKAHAAAQRLEQANKVMEELIKQQRDLDARRILGGQTEAGKPQEKQLSEQEKIDMENKLAFKGTILDGVFK